MFKCDDCERVFREPGRFCEIITGFPRHFEGCPYCGSEYYEDYYDKQKDEEEEEEGEENE